MFIPPPLRTNHDIRYDPTNVMKMMASQDTILPSHKESGKSKILLKSILESIPSITISILLILMVTIPFGLSFFPTEWTEIPVPRAIGIQMFLLTTIVCQIIFTLTSSFKCPIGLMMVENIPFMHTLSMGIIHDLGRNSPQALPTIVVTYSLSAVFVGLLFYLLGHFKLGSVMYFFPKHVTLGLIAGIGVFVVQTGVENAIGFPFQWTFDCIEHLLHPLVFGKWSVAVLLVVLLSIMTRYIQSPFFPPLFFILIPPCFYLVLGMIGVSPQEAREHGWFFNKAPEMTFWTMWEAFDFSQVAWWVIPRQFGTLLGLSLFSLMHVPINIPSLSLTTGTEIDINEELKSHGYSNAIGGLCGSVQNYLCYSFSSLYFKCGGGGKISSFVIASITCVFFMVGPNAVSLIPRCMAGCLMIHIGFDLLKEALFDTIGDLDIFEYCTVIVISCCMTFLGMNEGLAVGAVLACITFVMQSAPKGPIRGSMSASTLRSSAWRTPTALTLLSEVSRTIHVIQLQGHVFFGNVTKLSTYIKKKLDAEHIEYLILDFTLVLGMDSSAAERLSKIKHICTKRACHVVFAAIPSTYERFRSQLVETFQVCTTDDLNAALEYCEDELLHKHSYILADCERKDAITKPLHCLDDECGHLRQLQVLCPGESLSVLNRLLDYFHMKEIDQHQTLWLQGEESHSAVLLADGTLRAFIEEEAETIEDIKIGSLVGELCLLTGEKRKCTVRATERSVLYVLTRENLNLMIQQDSDLAFLFQSVALRYASFRLQYVGNRIWETKCLPI